MRSTDHATRGPLRMLDRFRTPRAEAILVSYLEAVQRVEDLAWDAHDYGLSIEDAIGIALDRIGKIVGRGRKSLSDGEYRRALRVQILINRFDGTAPELRKILALALPDLEARVCPRASGYAQIEVLADLSDDTRRTTQESLSQCVPLGTTMHLVTAREGREAHRFGWRGGSQGTPGLGWRNAGTIERGSPAWHSRRL